MGVVTINEELANRIANHLAEWGAECGDIANEVTTDEEEQSYMSKGDQVCEDMEALWSAIRGPKLQYVRMVLGAYEQPGTSGEVLSQVYLDTVDAGEYQGKPIETDEELRAWAEEMFVEYEIIDFPVYTEEASNDRRPFITNRPSLSGMEEN